MKPDYSKHYDDVQGQELAFALAEVLHYMDKGRIIGPLPKSATHLNGKKVIVNPIFTIEKGDSTTDNFRLRVVMDGSYITNRYITLKTTHMTRIMDVVSLANDVAFLWVADLKDAFWSIFANLTLLHLNGIPGFAETV